MTVGGAPPSEAGAQKQSAVVVWQFVDGKRGHEKQSAALLQGMEALLPLEVYDIDIRFQTMLWRQIRRYLFRGEPDLPAPDLLLGVGHRTHLPLLLARAACGGKTVVLMKPTLPHHLFDLLFVPHHDRVLRKSRVVRTRGVLCSSNVAPKTPGSGLILLGGTSPYFDWTNAEIGRKVDAIVRASPDVQWQVCDSRRTPEGIAECLPAASNLQFRHWRATPVDFLETALPTVEYVWVSADSASMLYESLSAQARVGVIALEPKRRRGNKHSASLRELIADGYAMSSADGFRLKGGAPRFPPENRRCAEIVVERLLTRRRNDSGEFW